MAVRVRYALQAAVSSTTNEDKDLGNVKFEVVTDLETKGGTWRTRLLAGQTDVQIHLDNIVTAHLLIIRTTASDPNDTPGSISVKRNSTGGEAILIKPVGDSKEGIFLISTDNLTAIYATNSGSVDMDLTITVAGV